MLKLMKEFFFGYSTTSKAYRVFNKRTLNLEESIHVTFEECSTSTNEVENDDVDNDLLELKNMSLNENEISDKFNNETNEDDLRLDFPLSHTHSDLPKKLKYANSHPQELILGDPSKGVSTRNALKNV